MKNDLGINTLSTQMATYGQGINGLTSLIRTNSQTIKGQENRLKKVELKNSVWFDAVRKSSFDASGSWKVITYNAVRRSSSYSYAMSTSTGKFTAPLAGTYQFFLQAYKYPGVDGEVRIRLDGTTVSYISDRDEPNAATITGTAIIELQPGQKVWAETFEKLISSSSSPRIHFTGVLITPK